MPILGLIQRCWQHMRWTLGLVMMGIASLGFCGFLCVFVSGCSWYLQGRGVVQARWVPCGCDSKGCGMEIPLPGCPVQTPEDKMRVE